MRSHRPLLFSLAILSLGSAVLPAQEPWELPAPTAQGPRLFKASAVDSDAHHSTTTDAAAHDGGVAADSHAGVDASFGGYPYYGWHAGYQHPMWGRPLALIVPPVVQYQTNYGWGVSSTRIDPIYPQFSGPGYGTPWTDPGQYHMPPYQPWDTRQFGVYYIRGPW